MKTSTSQAICTDTLDTDLAGMKSNLIDIGIANRLAEVFKALSDPTRLRLISLLLDHEVCVHSLADTMQMSPSAISHQLRFLRQLRLVRHRKAGRHVFYALDDEHIRSLFVQGIDHVQHK
jgi:DNA-binding transcriptional ArsR family regulator